MHAVALYDHNPAKDPVVLQVVGVAEAQAHAADAWATGRYALIEIYGPGPIDADHDGIPDSVVIQRFGDAQVA